MNSMDGQLVIKNGEVLLRGGELRCCDVRIENGQITDIGLDISSESALDATGSYVLPGLIDLHTHGIGFEFGTNGSLKEYARVADTLKSGTFHRNSPARRI